MHSLETLARLNREAAVGRLPRSPYRLHPCIDSLRQEVKRLPVIPEYRTALLRSLYCHANQPATRPHHALKRAWDDLEALQQMTLGESALSVTEHQIHAERDRHPQGCLKVLTATCNALARY